MRTVTISLCLALLLALTPAAAQEEDGSGQVRLPLDAYNTLVDTARNIQAMSPDILVIRHWAAGAPRLLTHHIDAAIVNAGDGWHEHPTQALLDQMTIKDKLGKIEGVKVVIIGDILHSRVARSNIWGLTKLGARVSVVGPPTMMPKDIEKLGMNVGGNFFSLARTHC